MQNTDKFTLVLGASENPERYSCKAIRMLRQNGHSVYALGQREGKVEEVSIYKSFENLKNVPDTITLYLNPMNQEPFLEKILELKPSRIIFNPGTENPKLQEMAETRGIETLEACTLVLLSTGNY